jgi:hypothetical protein
LLLHDSFDYLEGKRFSFLLESALISVVLGAGLLSNPGPAYHAQAQPVAGGAELVTVYAKIDDRAPGTPHLDVPVLAVLRDSLGDHDAENDRLRSVWILTSTRPTFWQRAASALSFGYFRVGNRRHSDGIPSPTLDLAAPGKSVYSNLLGDSLQALELDPLGAAIRSTTRTYRGNSADYNKLQVFQALANLDNLALQPGSRRVLPDGEFDELYARLSLSTRTFGGLVRKQNLVRYYEKQTSQQQEMRGHNWELLRQRAELDGLWFEPLAMGSNSPSQALLWIARSDLAHASSHPFDGQFLNIANPWTDARLQHWTGYSQIRYFDSSNRLASKDAPDFHPVEMIPLALYSLDYPRVPLLLADFRRSLAPKRREMVDKGATGLLTGVLGFTRFGNPSFFAAEWAWLFVRGRHGAAVNRTARLKAYSGAREFVAMDSGMDPGLRIQLQLQLDHLALNPRENDIEHEATLAQEQYATLITYLDSPRGEAKLDRNRRKELESYTHSAGRRMVAGLGQIIVGEPRRNPPDDNALRTQLDGYRRSAAQERFLTQVLASSPRPDVVWDAEAIRKAVDALSSDEYAGPEAQHLIAQVYERAGDSELRSACWRALQIFNQRTASITPAPREALNTAAQ